MSKLLESLKKEVEHIKKYENLPLEQISNFCLKRPLTEHEMSVLRLIATCETDTQEQYNNWLRSMVLCGHIKNFLKAAQEAEKRGFWERATYIEYDGQIHLGLDIDVPFPPKGRTR